MAKMKDLILDDYEENDYEYEVDYDYGKDSSDFIEEYNADSYANYESKSIETSSKQESGKKEKKDVYLGKGASLAVIAMAAFSNWFSILGVVIAAILILVFIFTLQFEALALYLIVLIGSFFFGYGFMYLLYHFTSNN